MSKRAHCPPAAVQEALQQLGRHIRIARLRRNLKISDLASRIGVSRYTISDIEKGKSTVSIESYLGVLWVLGLLSDLRYLADPDRDDEGKALESARLPKTAAKRKQALENDF